MSDSRPFQTYYEILGVTPTCSDREIEVSYRRLALEHHPDKQKNPNKNFQTLVEIKEILLNPSLRLQYDRKLIRIPGLDTEQSSEIALYNPANYKWIHSDRPTVYHLIRKENPDVVLLAISDEELDQIPLVNKFNKPYSKKLPIVTLKLRRLAIRLRQYLQELNLQSEHDFEQSNH